jgi:hypothetical protein
MAGLPYDFPAEFPPEKWSFASELKKAHTSSLIIGRLNAIEQDMYGAFGTSQREAEQTRAVETAAKEVTGGKRRQTLKRLAHRMAKHLSDDLNRLEALRDDVDYIGELEHLDVICEAITRRRTTIEAVSHLIAEPRLAQPKNNAAWHEQYYFGQVVDVWRVHGGNMGDAGFEALCDIATALWRDMGQSIPNWQTDNPDRTWASRRVKPHWGKVTEQFAG